MVVADDKFRRMMDLALAGKKAVCIDFLRAEKNWRCCMHMPRNRELKFLARSGRWETWSMPNGRYDTKGEIKRLLDKKYDKGGYEIVAEDEGEPGPLDDLIALVEEAST